MRAAKLLAACLIISAAPALAESARYLREARLVMGTTLEITLCPGSERRVMNRAFEIAQELDDMLSNYKSSSEVSKLNNADMTEAVPLSLDLLELLELSLELNKLTFGAFDITVGSLTQLWREAEVSGMAPESSAISAAKSSIGSKWLSVDKNARTAAFLKPGMAIDTGGIGKGFAVDRIVKMLRESKVECALVNFGHSSSYAFGSPKESDAWRLSIDFPNTPSYGVLELKNAALSASDTFGRPVKAGGVITGNIVDPRTGNELNTPKRSVVTTTSAAAAEALSKALLILNEEEIARLRSSIDFEYLLVDQRGDMERSRSFKFFPSRSRQ
ncbi:MAG: FAD:protein FMN transferase [Deltaproteobacteria bacterium]|nr:FAD:protein FMN transferase [Deltaproteobacteria bacterium]